MPFIQAIADYSKRAFDANRDHLQFILNANVVAVVFVAFIAGMRTQGDTSAIGLMFAWLAHGLLPFNILLLGVRVLLVRGNGHKGDGRRDNEQRP